MHAALLFLLCLFISQKALPDSLPGEAGATPWMGPTSGPTGQSGKNIIFISQDSKNGGISTLFRHFQLAATTLEWYVDYIDGENNLATIKAALTAAEYSPAHAVVLGGISLSSVTEEVSAVKKPESSSSAGTPQPSRVRPMISISISPPPPKRSQGLLLNTS